MITQSQKDKLLAAHKHRERHANHCVGDELYFDLEFRNKYVKGIVYQVVPYACIYYILEVGVPGLGDCYLHMVIQYQIRTVEELVNV